MSSYTFRCKHCESTGTSQWSSDVRAFTEHHMHTVHPLFTAETNRNQAPKPKRIRIRSASASLRVSL